MNLKRAATQFFSLSLLLTFAGCATQPHPSAYSPQANRMQSSPVSISSSQFAQPRTIEHVVGPQETLWRISKIYDVDMNTLMRINHINNANELKNGQRLTIPNTYGPRPVIPLYPSRKWTHIVIHHTATHEGNASSIDKMHQKRGFWNGLGYHFLIDNGTDGKFAGQIEVGPRWIKQQDGAHANANNMNEEGIGIALVGNFSESHVSRAQFDSLVHLVRTLQQYYRIPNSRVIGHREVPGKNTECPGTRFPWREFKQQLS